jgi:hypothetical protein
MVARAARVGSAAVAIGVVATAVAAAWAGGSVPADSGIRGRVVPCGIVHERAQCRDVRAAVVRVRRAADGRLRATARPDAKGRFRIPLAPGRYTVEAGAARAPAPARRAARMHVTVRAHAWTTVVLPTAPLSPPRPATGGRSGR